MPKNRDYTGLERTPSSMAWLIAQRARIRGQIERYQRQQETLPEKIQRLELELACLDQVIPFHRVKVDPQAIVGVRPMQKRAAAYGDLNKSLLRSLREAAGEPVSTAELGLQFARLCRVDLNAIGRAELMDRVRKRLAALVKAGVVRRCHPVATTDHGSWALVLDTDEVVSAP